MNFYKSNDDTITRNDFNEAKISENSNQIMQWILSKKMPKI